MSPLIIFLSVLFYVLLGMAYCKGYDVTKEHSPGRLPQFYFVMAAIRFLLVASAVAIYVFFSKNREDTLYFTAMFFAMYVIMMVVTLKLKH